MAPAAPAAQPSSWGAQGLQSCACADQSEAVRAGAAVASAATCSSPHSPGQGLSATLPLSRLQQDTHVCGGRELGAVRAAADAARRFLERERGLRDALGQALECAARSLIAWIPSPLSARFLELPDARGQALRGAASALLML